MVLKNVKKVAYCIIAFVILSLSAFSYIQTKRVGLYRDRCEYYRVQLTEATNREQQLVDSVRRTAEILSSTTNTVGDLREKLKAVRQEYENMEKLLSGVSCDTSRGTDK